MQALVPGTREISSHTFFAIPATLSLGMSINIYRIKLTHPADYKVSDYRTILLSLHPGDILSSEASP